jgi:glycosyltransferase involved in cell wall biosynthesis
MNLTGLEYIPIHNFLKISAISYLHDLRELEVYRLADTFIENERFFYRVYRFKSVRNFVGYFLISISPKTYLLLMKKLASKWLKNMKKKITRTSYLIVNSRWTFNQARNYLTPEIDQVPIKIIHPPKVQNFEEYVSLVDSYSEPFFLAMMANRKEKNISIVLKALDILCNSNINNQFNLVITGSDREFEKYVKAHFSFKGNVKMLDYVSTKDLHTLISKCVAVLITSVDEGFGFPILEAMETQAHVICSDIEVFHEFCNGNCEFFAPYDYEALARIMQNLIKKEENKDSDRQKFSDTLTWYSKSSNIRLDMIAKTIIDHVIKYPGK